jgi:hypothetical protein
VILFSTKLVKLSITLSKLSIFACNMPTISGAIGTTTSGALQTDLCFCNPDLVWYPLSHLQHLYGNTITPIFSTRLLHLSEAKCCLR